MKHPLTHLALWLPVPAGALFSPVVSLGHHLYRGGKIEVQGAAGLELLHLFLALVLMLTSAATAIQLLREERRAWGIPCAVAAILLGLYLLGIGFQRGAALLYAT